MLAVRFTPTVLKVTLWATACVMLAACAAITPEPSAAELHETVVDSQLYIDNVEVENRDGEYYAVISGNYADSCTEVSDVTTAVTGKIAEVAMTASRPADALCAQVLTPFEDAIPLNMGDLESGEYTVTVNGVSTTFQVGEEEPMAGTEPAMTESQAYVDSVAVENRDGEYYVTVKGNYADSCTTVGDVTTEVEGNSVSVNVEAVKPADAICAQMLTPFEEEIVLDVEGVAPGEYVVDVDGATTTFTVSP